MHVALALIAQVDGLAGFGREDGASRHLPGKNKG
jgi:hypothetical protein